MVNHSFVSQTNEQRARSDASYQSELSFVARVPYHRLMGLPVRKKLPHAVPQWVAEGSWFFITIKCVPQGNNQLCRADTGDAMLAAMAHNHDKLVWHSASVC